MLDLNNRPDVSLVTVLSYLLINTMIIRLDRLDRLPYIYQRWKGPIVFTLFVNIDNITDINQCIHEYGKRRNTLFNFYIYQSNVKDDNYFINYINNTIFKVNFENSLFPINLLRSIGIHSIKTTHFTVMDIDLLPSETLYNNFKLLPECILEDPYSAILVPAFVVNKESFKNCRDTGNCTIS